MSLKAEGLEELISPLDLRYKILYLVSIWCEGTIYGIYVCLFGASLNVMLREGKLKTVPAKVFFAGTITMFLLISVHNWMNVYRLVVAYAFQITVTAPVEYMRNMANWDAYAFPLLLSLIIWLGDALVIYRCFLIWQRNWLSILVPLLLLLTSVGTHSVNLHWWRTGFISEKAIQPWLHTTFPLHLAQNLLTTGLITYKIWDKHRESERVGMQEALAQNGLDLVGIIRIVIESAAVYTLQMLMAVILQILDHPAKIILQHCLAPTTGIVFVLLAIRADTLRKEAMSGQKVTASELLIPAWLGGKRTRQRSGRGTLDASTVPIQIVATVTEEYRMDDITSDLKMRHRHTSSTGKERPGDLENGSSGRSSMEGKAVAF